VGDLLVADSAVLADVLRHDGVADRRLTVITNAVDRKGLEAVRPSEGAPEVLFVGRLIDHKRADVAIRALTLLRPRPVPPRLGIVGVGPERATLESLARDLGVADRVEFLGTVDDDRDVAALVRGASVFVSTSEREGFGLTVAEALALGTPVVTVQCPENHARLLVEDGVTGSVVAPGDATAVAATIDSWLDRDARETVRTSFWTTHPELDWEESARSFSALLRRLAST
jgi:glycosyltransferase involved in cell wall biosynthesis